MKKFIFTFTAISAILMSQYCLADEHIHTSLDKKYEVTLNKEIDCPECAQAMIDGLKKVFKCQVQFPKATAKTNTLYFSSISVDIEDVKSELRNIGYEVTDVKTLAAAEPFKQEDIK